jgi:hypothetical protein
LKVSHCGVCGRWRMGWDRREFGGVWGL